VIAGIDLGTQGVKVLLFDRGLKAAGRAFVGYPTRLPRPGWAEQDPADWEQALGRAAHRAAREAGVDPAAVEAVGVTGQLDGCVAVGRDGLPLHPGNCTDILPVFINNWSRLQLHKNAFDILAHKLKFMLFLNSFLSSF